MPKLKIEKPNSVRRGVPPVFGILLFLILLSLGAYFFLVPARALPAFEVQSFSGDVQVYSAQKGIWEKPDRGSTYVAGDKIRTGPVGEIDLMIPETLKMRLKENSSMVYEKGTFYAKNPQIQVYLDKGQLYASTQKGIKDERIRFLTPQLSAETNKGSLYLDADPAAGTSWMGVLKGEAQVKKNSLFPGSTFTVKSLEKSEVTLEKPATAPVKISRKDWLNMREVYELSMKSALQEAQQLDLSKKAGSLFDYVFDHGTFYTPKVGYCGREFAVDPATGKTYLEIEYDVFPTGSYVGMYIKTRDLEINRNYNLEFEMRRLPDAGYAQNIRIEIKNKSGILRAFAAKSPKLDWQKVSFPLRFNSPVSITEVAFVFLNHRVGEYKKGIVQFRNINLIESPEPEHATDV